MRADEIRLGVQYAIHLPGLPSPRPALVFASAGAGAWLVWCTRYRQEERVQVDSRQVVAPWVEHQAELAAAREQRLARQRRRRENA